MAGAMPTGGGIGTNAPYCVEAANGYNCWPMIQAVRGRLVCVYSMGRRHGPGETGRGVYSRTSADKGRTWSDRVTVASDPKSAQSVVGKGLDEKGEALFWVRRYGRKSLMALYRTQDGTTFECVAEPAFAGPMMQITDIFHVPGVGMMAFWFGGSYGKDEEFRHWGVVTSADNGRTWHQRVCGDGMGRKDWPTEPSGFYAGNGRIFCVARTEVGPAQFQLTSTDFGATWKVSRTNIRDVMLSTPSLLLDEKTGLVRNYYYQREAGFLKRRTARLSDVFDNAMAWPDPEILVSDRGVSYHAGNANAVEDSGVDYVAYYTGNDSDCAVMVMPVPVGRLR